jgi:uracil-DNA glycosylase
MSTAALSLLRQYLESRREAGRKHVAMTPASVQAVSGLRARVESRLRQQERALDEALSAPMAEVLAPQVAADPLRIQVAGASREEKLEQLRALAERAPEARGLGTLRDTMVFAVGNPHASLMLVGEAPGFQEERQREPFVGPAGEKLTLILKAMGLARDAVYISNICKFRPAMEENEGDQGTKNRKPTEVEMRACLPFVMTEIDIVRPKCLVALGATAAEGLGLQGSVGQLRGRQHEIQGIPTVVTYHPSYVLREEKMGDGMRVKRQVWEDMMMAMEILGMPISAKQRGYFSQS